MLYLSAGGGREEVWDVERWGGGAGPGGE